MNLLGGSLFVHNGLKYDYCLKEAVESLLDLCDEVVILDAESDDGTLDFLHKMAKEHSNLKVYDHGKWECASDWNRLRLLANETKNILNTEWHFMLQADEVIHENSFDAIRKAISDSQKHDTFWGYRINVFKDFDHYIAFNSKTKPCGDKIIRLGKTYIDAIGDAESLSLTHHSNKYLSKIIMFHYGIIRKPDIMLDKYISMQSWFFDHGKIDPRILEMKKTDGIFKPEKIIEGITLDKLKWTHPKYAEEWVKERRHFYE